MKHTPASAGEGRGVAGVCVCGGGGEGEREIKTEWWMHPAWKYNRISGRCGLEGIAVIETIAGTGPALSLLGHDVTPSGGFAPSCGV